MKEVNLRKYYPFYTEDVIVPVPDEIAELLAEFDRSEDAYRIRTYRNKAMYSLDLLDEIREFPSDGPLPEELVEQRKAKELLYRACIFRAENAATRNRESDVNDYFVFLCAL